MRAGIKLAGVILWLAREFVELGQSLVRGLHPFRRKERILFVELHQQRARCAASSQVRPVAPTRQLRRRIEHPRVRDDVVIEQAVVSRHQPDDDRGTDVFAGRLNQRRTQPAARQADATHAALLDVAARREVGGGDTVFIRDHARERGAQHVTIFLNRVFVRDA